MVLEGREPICGNGSMSTRRQDQSIAEYLSVQQQTHATPVTLTTKDTCCDYHPVRSHLTAVMTLFAFAIVQLSQLYTQLELTLYTRSLSVRREKYGIK